MLGGGGKDPLVVSSPQDGPDDPRILHSHPGTVPFHKVPELLHVPIEDNLTRVCHF